MLVRSQAAHNNKGTDCIALASSRKLPCNEQSGLPSFLSYGGSLLGGYASLRESTSFA